jgi:hypothetical protein
VAFTLIRELGSFPRENGLKRLLLALYSASENSRYIALSEQQRSSTEDDFVSMKKGITIRKSEVANIISALQSADFDAKPDGNGLTPQEYSTQFLDWV